MVFVRVDDLQVHKQFPKDQQGIHDDQEDNRNLSEEKNYHELPLPAQADQQEEPTQPLAEQAPATLVQVPAWTLPASLIPLVAFHGAFCGSHPGLPPNPAISHHLAQKVSCSSSRGRARASAGTVTSVH